MTTPPWDRVESSWWPQIAASLQHPWPAEAACMDLRWYDSRVYTGMERRMPPYRHFKERWGWTDHQTRKLMKNEALWVDPISRKNRADSTQESRKSEPKEKVEPTAVTQESRRLHAGITTRADLHPTPHTPTPEQFPEGEGSDGPEQDLGPKHTPTTAADTPPPACGHDRDTAPAGGQDRPPAPAPSDDPSSLPVADVSGLRGDIARVLHRVGIQTLGDLASLTRDELHLRDRREFRALYLDACQRALERHGLGWAPPVARPQVIPMEARRPTRPAKAIPEPIPPFDPDGTWTEMEKCRYYWRYRPAEAQKLKLPNPDEQGVACG